MSWRRFRILYNGLSPGSLVYLNYDRIARKEGVQDSAAEKNAWETLTGLSKPKGG